MLNDGLAHTRRALHAVAEYVLAGPQHRASGTIKLRVAPGGFRTWAEPALAVVGTDLLHAGIAHPIAGRTAYELAAMVGLEAEAPTDVYRDGCGVPLDEPLEIEATAAQVIADAYARGEAALRLLAPDLEPVLWPEHFDVGIRLADVNYGVSPGDSHLAEPYAYVGIDPIPPDDPYWNAPFGATRPVTTFLDAQSMREFFEEARQRLNRDS